MYISSLIKRIALVSLFSLSVFATNVIPTLKNDCIGKVDHILSELTVEQKPVFEALTKQAETIDNGREFAVLLAQAKDNQIQARDIYQLALLTPYIEINKISERELANAIVELYQSPMRSSVDSAVESLQKNLPGYKYGFKQLADKREYDAVIKILGIKNQCRLGSCWTYAGTALKENLLAPLLPIDTPISAELFYANYVANIMKRQLKEKFFNMDALEKVILPESEIFNEGNNLPNFMALAQEFGVAPESAYKPIKQYHTAEHKGAFMGDLRDILEEYHAARKALQVNRSISKASKTEKIKALNRATARKIDTVVESYAGPLQPKFEYDGQMYTPKEFYHAQVKRDFNTLRAYYKSSYNQEGWTNKNSVSVYDENLRSSYPTFQVQNNYMNQEGYRDLVKKNIDAGKPLYIAVDIPVSTYTDPKTGKSHTIINGNDGKVTVEGITGDPKVRGGHALVIVGYELDHRGQLKTLKIQNSWGDEHGDEGFLHFDESFIWKYMRVISILD